MPSPVAPLALGAAVTYVQTAGTQLDFLVAAEMTRARGSHQRHDHIGGVRAERVQSLLRMHEGVFVDNVLLTSVNTRSYLDSSFQHPTGPVR